MLSAALQGTAARNGDLHASLMHNETCNPPSVQRLALPGRGRVALVASLLRAAHLVHPSAAVVGVPAAHKASPQVDAGLHVEACARPRGSIFGRAIWNSVPGISVATGSASHKELHFLGRLKRTEAKTYEQRSGLLLLYSTEKSPDFLVRRTRRKRATCAKGTVNKQITSSNGTRRRP